jgi:hypothetical protein
MKVVKRANEGRAIARKRGAWQHEVATRQHDWADKCTGAEACSKFMKLFIFLSRRCSAGSWRHQDDTGTVAPRKPTSSWAPADRKALARSRLIEWQGFAPNVGGGASGSW